MLPNPLRLLQSDFFPHANYFALRAGKAPHYIPCLLFYSLFYSLLVLRKAS